MLYQIELRRHADYIYKVILKTKFMDETQETIKKKLKEGWIHSSLLIEVLAATAEAAKSALEKHVDKMGTDKRIILTKKDFKEVREVEKPIEGIEKAYSYLVHVEFLADKFETLVYVAMTYGPTSMEILNPDSIKINLAQAHAILNTIADMIHRFAQMRGGGILINS